MSEFTDQVNNVITKVLVPAIRTLASTIAIMSRFSTRSEKLLKNKRQLNYYRLLYEYLTEYANGNELIPEDKLVQILQLCTKIPTTNDRY